MRVTMTGVVNSHLSQLLLSASLEVSNQFLASLEETQSVVSTIWLSEKKLLNCLESNGEMWSYYCIVSSCSGEVTYIKRDENSDLVPFSSGVNVLSKRAFAPDARVRPRVSAEERSQLGAGEGSFEIVEIETTVSVMVEVMPIPI